MTIPEVPDFMYRRLTPSPQLAPYIEHYWLVSAPAEAQPRREILIPNGRPMLLLSFAVSSKRIDPVTGKGEPNGDTLSEICSQPFVIEQFGASRYIGVQFRPYGLSAFLPGERIVNQLTPLAEWLGEVQAAELRELLLAAEFGQARVEALDTFLQSILIPMKLDTLELLGAAITGIEAVSDEVKIEDLAAQFNMHYTTFYRLFNTHVGISPKRYLDIIRYYHFVGDLLNNANNDSRALLASLQGYYDQAHASKEFRRFTGVTASVFKSTLNNIAKLMHQR